MTIKEQLISKLQQITEEMDLKGEKWLIDPLLIKVDCPADSKHGDYATNIALIMAKRAKKNPMDFAEDLRFKIKDLGFVEKVEVVKPGFINFWIRNEFMAKSLENESLGSSLIGRKIMIEFTDPNPFKEFHIGHLYSNIVGESLSRLLEANGAEVARVDYYGDVGMHVAKSLWGLKKKFEEDGKDLKQLEKLPLEDRIQYLGQAYAKGATAYEDVGNNPKPAQEMKLINRLVYLAAQRMWQEEKNLSPQIDYKQGHKINEEELEEIYKLYKTGRVWSLEYFESIYKRLGTIFYAYYPESIAAEHGYKIVKDNPKVFVKSNDATVFPGEKYGLHTRVFINALGFPTYEAKELGLAPWKYKEFPYDESLIVTGNEINEYFNVLICAMKQTNPDLGEKTKHIGHGMVRLPEGKMSSRTGKVKTGKSLLDAAKEQAKKLSENEDEELVDQIGQAAVKYAFLKSGIGKDIIFDFEESVSFEGNSGPYLQYTFARTQSVLTKSGISNFKSSTFAKASADKQISNLKLETEERELLRLLVRFPEIVGESAERLAPNLLCTYLFELAQAFNVFYQKCPILKAKEESKQFRLALTKATGNTLRNGLMLLGIQSPEKM